MQGILLDKRGRRAEAHEMDGKMGRMRGLRPQTRPVVGEESGRGEDKADCPTEGTLEAQTDAILVTIKDTKTSLKSQIVAVVNKVVILRDQQQKPVV